jgi:hypothetical protein
MAIHLGCPSPNTSSDQPEWQPGNRLLALASRHHPYSVLLPVGFTLPRLLPATRCALTAPFHPCPRFRNRWRFAFCGTFPEVTLAGRYPAPCLHGARTFLRIREFTAISRHNFPSAAAIRPTGIHRIKARSRLASSRIMSRVHGERSARSTPHVNQFCVEGTDAGALIDGVVENSTFTPP